MTDKIAILDFGSQYTQLIARRLREMKVYSEIFSYDISMERLKEFNPRGIILSGGPSSVYEQGAPYRSIRELKKIAPLLGICYGMQLMAKDLGGEVSSSQHREYGLSYIQWHEGDQEKNYVVWMSHGDTVNKVPQGFKVCAKNQSGGISAMRGDQMLAYQFHPEVSHTQNGEFFLGQFVFDLCNIKPQWTTENIINEISDKILKLVPNNEKVLCALSGGVDSTVVGVLLSKILGLQRVECVFVNNGLLRKNEFQDVLEIYKKLNLNVTALQCESNFLERLKDVEDPEKKRKIIGNLFIEVFEHFLHQGSKDIQWLAQGTLYPDVIESVSPRGTSVTIKTHHNVGGLPEKMKLKLVEPLRELFKDEVREIGRELGIPRDILERHPFPGPGLAVRVLGCVTKENLNILRDCDFIFIDELKKAGLYSKIWQAFCVLLPIRSVGVQGDNRTYEKTVALRAITSRDGMTADFFEFPMDFLKKVSNRITNEVKHINRVVYDITSKPPATIEWE